MTGGHVQGDILAPEDVVSLLLDDAQLEQKLREIPVVVGPIYLFLLFFWSNGFQKETIFVSFSIFRSLKTFCCQAKDRQKKKQAKGIRVDAEGDASLEDLTNAEPRGTEYEPSPDLEKTKSTSKKVLHFLYVFYCRQILIFQTW